MAAAVNIALLRKKNSQCLAVSFPYNQIFVKKIKRISGRSWDNTNRRWEVPLVALKELRTLFPDAVLSTGIAEYLESQKAVLEKRKEKYLEVLENIDLEKPLTNGLTLFAHQRESVIRMIKNHRQILALDMGLGKTLTALITAKLFQQKYNWSVIVVCPVSLGGNWKRDALGLGVKIEIHSWAKVPVPPMGNYILICDEAHYAQSGSKSQRGQRFLTLAKSSFCRIAYLLTGTPIKNGRPINLLPLLEAVKHPLAQDKTYFHLRYCDAKKTPWSRWDTSGVSNLPELYERTKDAMIRKTKAECLDLPDKLRILREVELSAKAKAIYDETLSDLRQQYLERVADGTINGGSESFVLFGQLRQAGSIAKVETALEIAQEILEEKQQLVIFTEFRKSLQLIYEELSKLTRCEILHGQIDKDERPKMVDRFQSGESKVFISTIGAGGVGLTLTKAQTVLLVDRPLTPGDAEQAEDRCHRIGQKSNVTCIWLQYGEVDTKVDIILQEKSKNIEAILTGLEDKSNIQFSSHKLAMQLLPKLFKTNRNLL